jgi:hypothetical protein
VNTLFTHINNIIHFKKRGDVDLVDSDPSYNNYMMNRWISMYSPQMATIINYTTNIYYSIINSKSDHLKLMLNVIPKSKIYRINYIKKKKVTKDNDINDIIKYLAEQLELSEREIKYYIDSHNIDVTKYKHLCKTTT